jgi:hypothetical protein
MSRCNTTEPDETATVCLGKVQDYFNNMGKTGVAQKDKRCCQQALADAQGWQLYKQWLQNTESNGDNTYANAMLDEAIQ